MSFNKQKRKKTNVGISITRHAIEVAVYSEKGNGIEFALSVPTPAGMLDANGDQVVDKELLRQTLVSLVRQVPGKHKFVNLSVPGSLVAGPTAGGAAPGRQCRSARRGRRAAGAPGGAAARTGRWRRRARCRPPPPGGGCGGARP